MTLGAARAYAEALAASALALGQAERAARLLGAAEAAWARGFSATIPGFEAAQAGTARAIEAALDGATVAAARSAGAALGLAEVLAEAQALVAQAATPGTTRAPQPPHPAGRPGGLSDRELEVLCLLANGRSNAEIAAELTHSVRTVEKHVANIYAKIGARGRADAATYALRHGLLPTPR
jgi:DNA-binding NarL/FixJ family response regulator